MSRTPSEKDRLLPTSADKLKISDDNAKLLAIEEEKGSGLVIAFGLMIIFSLGNRIFGKLETYPMHNYPMFMSILVTVMYIPLSFMYIIPVQLFTNNITKEVTDVPKKSFLVMGALDSVASTMQMFAVNYITSASITVLVQQSAIPISMGLSAFFLGARYTYPQYTGAAIVLCGIVAVLLPTFFSNSSSLPPDQLIWVFAILVSNVPSVYSSVYKEKALGEVDIDMVYLVGWMSIFQTLISIPLCIPSAMAINVPIADIPSNIIGGFNCLRGINTILEANESGTVQPDDCSMAFTYVSIYMLFNVGYNLVTVVILKKGSANILWMASTVIVPLSNVAFSLDFIPNHQPMKPMDIVGLVIIMSGLVVYRFTAQLYTLYESLSGKKISDEEVAIRHEAHLINMVTEMQQTKLIGLNQAEFMNALVDSRVMKAQRTQLFRSPAQARGHLLFRLGIPPSPNITMMKSATSVSGSPRVNYSASPSGATSSKPNPMSYEFSPKFTTSPRAQQRRAAQLAAQKKQKPTAVPEGDERASEFV